MTVVDVTDYRPDNDLDAELADLFRDALAGWPDGRPLTAQVIRGWLRPLSLTATTLAVHRGPGGRLLAAAALRWPGGPAAIGRLLGPFVHPDGRGAGLATAVLQALDTVIDHRPGVRVATVSILESRQAGWSLFERAGWQACGKASLLTMALPESVDGLFDRGFAADPVAVRTIAPGEYVDPLLTELIAGARPEQTYASARDTFTRWSTDERYTPDGLLLADGPDSSGRLLGAALVYPMRRPDSDEPPEATLVDLVVAGQLDQARAAAVRTALVAAVIEAGVKLGAQVARAFEDDEDVAQALLANGFELSDRIRYYGRSSEPIDPSAPFPPLGPAL